MTVTATPPVAPRVVLDTSVLLSVAGRPSVVYPMWKTVLDGELIAITCPSTLDELRDVLSRPNIPAHYAPCWQT